MPKFHPRIKSLLVLGDDQRFGRQHLRLRQRYQRLCILLAQPVRRIEKHEIRNHAGSLPLPKRLCRLSFYDGESARYPRVIPVVIPNDFKFPQSTPPPLSTTPQNKLSPPRGSAPQCPPPPFPHTDLATLSPQRLRIPRAQHVKQRLPQTVGRRTHVQALQRPQRPAPILTCNHTHIRLGALRDVRFTSLRNLRPPGGV